MVRSMSTSSSFVSPRSRPFAWRELAGASLVAWAVMAPGVSGVVALLAGALVGTTCGTPAWSMTASGVMLRAGIVASGARLPLTAVLAAGADGLVGSAVVLVAVALLAGSLWRPLRLDGHLVALIASGTAICGGSAVAAVAPAIGARAAAVASALAVVFALNGLALVVFPWLGAALPDDAYAQFCALGIHDTSSVVGAASVRGDEVLARAVALKLARSLWIVPVALVAASVVRRTTAHRQTGGALPRPWFIAGFVLVSALVTWVPAIEPAAQVVAASGARLMNGALVCVGFSLTPKALGSMGWRPLLLGVLLWGPVVGLAYTAV